MREDTAELPPVPTGLQSLLVACSGDPALLEKLVEGRAAAAAGAGFNLAPEERAALEAVTGDQLRQMATAYRLAAGSALPRLRNLARPAGIRPGDIPRPDRNLSSKGIRPGLPLGSGRRIPWAVLVVVLAVPVFVLYFWLRGP